MKKVECFKIQILENDNIWDVSRGKVIKQIICEPKVFIREPKVIEADPFLFVHNDILYLFYEDKTLFKPGVISMIYTKDLKKWSTPQVVLSESCHLSYPWIFENDGHVYMIPETSVMHEIRLYEAANNSLTEFKLIKILLKDNRTNLTIGYSDSSIYKIDNIYYLMTTINNGKDNILELYISDMLIGPYKVHSCSPIVVDNKLGRNAGGLFQIENNLYRVAQDCVNGYGNDVHLLKIDEISKTNYSEHICKENILAKRMPFYKYGGHQFHYIVYKNKKIVATDAKEYHYFFIQKVCNKFGLYKRK